jgi:hypothetical protein
VRSSVPTLPCGTFSSYLAHARRSCPWHCLFFDVSPPTLSGRQPPRRRLHRCPRRRRRRCAVHLHLPMQLLHSMRFAHLALASLCFSEVSCRVKLPSFPVPILPPRGRTNGRKGRAPAPIGRVLLLDAFVAKLGAGAGGQCGQTGSL